MQVASFEAGQPINRFLVVRSVGSNQVKKNTTKATPSVGITQDTVSATGSAVPVAIGGIVKGAVGRSVTKDQALVPDSTARLVHGTTENDKCVGFALESQATVGGLTKLLWSPFNF